jgi:hypothetical protein
MKLKRVLKYKCYGDDVKELQRILRAQGYFKGAIAGNFLSLTKGAVLDFQLQHLGPNGKPLVADGEIWPGHETEWALNNPSGPPQKSNIGKNEKSKDVPAGVVGNRRKLIEAALKDYHKGVKEIPDGSNSGDGVEKYIKDVGPNPWCAFAVSEFVKDATGAYPMGSRHGHCVTMMKVAKKKNLWKNKTNYAPAPGDIFLMVTNASKSQGHTGIVYRVSSDGKTFNTIEGNCGNRLKMGIRSVDDGALKGFIVLWGEQTEPFEKGILSASQVSQENTR